MNITRLLVLSALLLLAFPAHADLGLRLDGGLSFSRFEQQVKSEIGGARGERLVEHNEAGLLLMATATVWGPIELGLYGQYDTGTRAAGTRARARGPPGTRSKTAPES